MKLVELQCKNCGAPLEADEGQKSITCNFCHTNFKIDDEVKKNKLEDAEQFGYEMEKGKIRAQKEESRYVNNNQYYNPSYRRAKNKWIALFLCIFTICGHKFYEGKIGVGILYLFTGGLFGWGWIIDIIILLTKPNPYYV